MTDKYTKAIKAMDRDNTRRANKEIAAARTEPTMEDLQAALSLAVNMLMAHEPPDSRAVSGEAVSLAAVACGDASGEVMPVIRRALAAAEKPQGSTVGWPGAHMGTDGLWY